jgi:hypothetical protein
MGLAFVEVAMAIEDEFKVSIPDEEYTELKTAGCLHWWLCRRLGVPDVLAADNGLCLNPAAFVRIRSSLVSVLGVARSSVRLSTSLADLLPDSSRRNLWQSLTKASGIEWPSLTYSSRTRLVRTISVGMLWALFAVTMLAVILVWKAGWLAFPLIVGLGICATLIDRLSVPFQTAFPLGISTVGNLTVYLAESQELHLRSLLGDDVARRQHDIWERLRAIVCDKLDVPLGDVHLHSRWIEDLHAD